jgi:hypothetical protein
MFMRHIGGGVGHSVINLTVQGPGGEDSDMDDCQGTAAGTEDEDNIGYEGDPEESEDSEDDFDYDEENDDSDDLEDDGEDELGPEDGEDEDFDDYDDGFADF